MKRLTLKHWTAGFLPLILFLPIFETNISANEWTLRQEKGDLKVYTRANADSGIKEVRITTLMETSQSGLMAALCDVPAYLDWVYKCSEARRLETVSEQEFFYYTKSDFPFPASDRDLIVHSWHWQDNHGVIHSRSSARPDYLPDNKGVVRIREFNSTWKISPVGPDKVSIEYEVKTNPGGSLPAWVINLGITSGPVKTMENLAAMVKDSRYRNAPVPAYFRH